MSKNYALECPKCGGHIEIEDSQMYAECPYCGSKLSISDILGESDEVKAERIKTEAYKSVEKEKIEYAKEQYEKDLQKQALEKFKKSKSSKVWIIFAVLALIISISTFSSGSIVSGLLALVIAVLLVVAWLMGMQIVPEKKKGMRTVAALIGFLLFIPCFALNSCGSSGSSYDNDKIKIEWDSLQLSKYLPEPASTHGEIYSDSAEKLSIEIDGYSTEEFMEYIKACQDKGFTVDSNKSSSTYDAKNESGYSLRLYLYSNDKELSIHLDAPVDKEEQTETTESSDDVNDSVDLNEDETDNGEKDSNKESKKDNTGLLDPDFKAAMDSYENFMNEYVSFMKKYSANPDDMGLLADYADYAGKYSKFADDFEKWDDKDMNTAETAYYIEVQSRVNKKLLEIAN